MTREAFSARELGPVVIAPPPNNSPAEERFPGHLEHILKSRNYGLKESMVWATHFSTPKKKKALVSVPSQIESRPGEILGTAH